MTKCPYCNRTLREHERYCDFCEQDITHIVEGKVKLKKIVKKQRTTAYCVKCKKKVNVKNPKDYTMKNKRQAIKGTCPDCSTKVFRILGMKK